MSDGSLGVRDTARRWARSGYALVGQGLALAKGELAILSTILVVTGGTWLFAGIADEVREGDTHSFDRAIVRAFRNPADLSDPIGPRWLEQGMRDITALGGGLVLVLLTLLVIGYLLIARRHRAALLVLVSVAGGTLLSLLLKVGFDRPRPDLVPHGTMVYTASFPSGHAMLSATVYLTIGALLTRMQVAVRLRIYLLGAATFVTILVGLSRIYLGVHWPTDVLAGWGLGAAWAMLVSFVALALQRWGKIRARGTGSTPMHHPQPAVHPTG